MQRVILHIDMNSYFASVEQQANPFFRGKPLGVCAYLSPNGCVLASSMEAKKFGVKTGMRAKDAKALCPHIILVENEPAKYRSVTEKIFSILKEYTDRFEPYSIDEAFLDLTGWTHSSSLPHRLASLTRATPKALARRELLRSGQAGCPPCLAGRRALASKGETYNNSPLRIRRVGGVTNACNEFQDPSLPPLNKGRNCLDNSPSYSKSPPADEARGMGGVIIQNDFTQAYSIALEIKRRITNEVGEYLKCSIGISYTRWLAKFASDIAEKNSILLLTPDILEKTLASVQLTDAWGIGDRIATRLERMGIKNLLDLKRYPHGNLLEVMGKYGYYLWANVNGVEIGGVKKQENTQPKSFGHQYALAKKTTDLDYLRGILMKLCEKTGRRLREHCLQAKNISAHLGYVRGGGVFKTRKTPEPLFTTASIYQVAHHILFSYPLADRARIISVSVGALSPISHQVSFLSDTIKEKKIALAMDAINNSFGEFTIMSGEMMDMQNFVHDRIGFRKIEI